MTPTGRRADPRRVAFEVVRAVDERGAYANLELARALREQRLRGRDAGFVTELVSGSLRMRRAYDAVIDSLVDRPLDPPVREALRLGAHQLLSMRVPAHAAVATTVSLVRSAIGHRPAGLVNAVLRRIGSRSFEDWMDHLDAPVAVRTSHPDWVVDLFAEALGGDPGELLEADNRPPAVTLAALPGLATVEELAAAGAAPSPVSPYAATLPAGDPGELAAVREGRASVQDAGSQLVALALASAPVDGPDSRWLDCCAGPGGKTALLAALLAHRDRRDVADGTPNVAETSQTGLRNAPSRRRRDGRTALLVASELQPHRARLVRSALRALPRDAAAVVVADATRPAWPPAAFDRVLVDAPCTGLGALRRRPEARWRRTPADLDDLVPLQRRLLTSAIESARRGGVVCYATCSPVLAETVEVVRAVLASRDDVRLEDAHAALPGPADARHRLMPEALQLWPHRHGTDAMFAALLRRT